MTTNYFVLSALSREWAGLLRGARFVGAYSHLPNEVSLDFEMDAGELVGIRMSSRPGNLFVYSQPDPRRAKSNVASLFEAASGRPVEKVAIAEGDRVISIAFADMSRFEIHPYGSRANVYLIQDGPAGAHIVESFKRSDSLSGQPPPPTRAAKPSLGLDDPRFASHLVKEAEFLSGDDPSRAFEMISEKLAQPSPVVYEIEGTLLFSPIQLGHLGMTAAKSFASVDDGVRWTVKNRSSKNRYKDATQQLFAALEKSATRWNRRVAELKKAMASESRAHRYEAWGHLLMAHPSGASPGAEEVELPDILGDGSIVTIPLDGRKTVIQNAQRYYDRARKTREERLHMTERLDGARKNAALVTKLLAELKGAQSLKDVEKFRKIRADDLRRFVGGKTEEIASAPFRRFRIAGGLEVWVGRNAKENDMLTFGHAAPHDLWMHARGTPGSHVVLKIPGRTQVVDKRAKEVAAAIAAWFSGARGSGLVPVQVTQKKYVTKPRGAVPGVVRVQNEEVVLVEPGLPSAT